MCSNTHIPQMSSQEAAAQASSLPAVCIRRGLMDRDFVTVHQRHLRDIRPEVMRQGCWISSSAYRFGSSEQSPTGGVTRRRHVCDLSQNGRGRDGQCEALVYPS